MNKLVLIGNGFDLAHGLKTKYTDFLLWYLETARINLCRNNLHDDCLMTITLEGEKPIYQLQSLKEFRALIKDGTCVFTPKSNFIENIILHAIDYKWVDIESQYYNSLLKIFDAIKNGHSLNKLNELLILNESLLHIKNLLIQYLSTINNIQETQTDIFNHLKIELEVYSNSRQINEILFLNFNYTSTIELYKDTLPHDLKIKINYIHGKLSDQNNPIIFGYGDEMDTYYERIEQFNNNEFTKNMKSFDYLKTKNYQNFLRFVNSGPFDVFIMGHSCGLSDRILLNSIFEHPRCERIKIYYHQKSKEENDFTEKTQEISRHFKPSAKGVMREKIVPFEDCKPLTTLT